MPCCWSYTELTYGTLLQFFYHIYLFLYKFESLPHLKLPICFLKHRCTIQHSSLVLHAFLLVHSHTQRFVLAVPIYFTTKDPSGLNTIYSNLPVTQIAGLQVQKWKKVDNSCFFCEKHVVSFLLCIHKGHSNFRSLSSWASSLAKLSQSAIILKCTRLCKTPLTDLSSETHKPFSW